MRSSYFPYIHWEPIPRIVGLVKPCEIRDSRMLSEGNQSGLEPDSD